MLVAEDDALVADGLALQLEALGHAVVGVASDGREALAAVRALNPDVVLLDIRMPVMDGLEVCRELMEERPLPVIMATGYGDHHLIAQAEACGAVGYLLKPSDERRLDAAIAQACARFETQKAPRTGNEAGQRATSEGQASATAIKGSLEAIAVQVGARRQGRIKVLLLEHHQLVGEALAAVVGGNPDLDVVGVHTDPDLAVVDVRRTRPDVLLIDYLLMLSRGVELTAVLRDQLPELKLVVLTPSLDEEILLRCARAGAVGCVTKDRPPMDLVRAIERVHDGEVLFPPAVLVNILTRGERREGEAETVVGPLAPRELEVLRVLGTGVSTREAAEQLGISVHTVRTHLKNAMAKLHAHSRLEAVVSALRQGLIELQE